MTYPRNSLDLPEGSCFALYSSYTHGFPRWIYWKSGKSQSWNTYSARIFCAGPAYVDWSCRLKVVYQNDLLNCILILREKIRKKIKQNKSLCLFGLDMHLHGVLSKVRQRDIVRASTTYFKFDDIHFEPKSSNQSKASVTNRKPNPLRLSYGRHMIYWGM